MKKEEKKQLKYPTRGKRGQRSQMRWLDLGHKEEVEFYSNHNHLFDCKMLNK